MENGLIKVSAGPQDKKGWTITFRVDDEVAEDVAVSPPASRLIADVQLDDGFSLGLGIVGSDRKFRDLLRESIDEFFGIQRSHIQSPVDSF